MQSKTVQPRVTTILVASSGADYLERTLAALAAQTRKPDVTIAVDVSSSDGSEALLAASGPAQVLSVRDGTSFGSAVTHALQFAPDAESSESESDNEWLWLLGHDNAPHPDALAQLLSTVERAPSVAVAGPKLMRHDRADMIAAFGETMSTFGVSVALVEEELDQGQHDTRDDVLGVAAAGLLVRRSLWKRLGGFDPGLPSIDAALDFSVRARLAGHRVVLVPGARVASAGGPETFGSGRVSARRRFRIARAAQLHRRLVYSPAWAVAFHWLSLVPLALVRSIGDLVGKRPGAIGGEFGAAVSTAFAGRVGAARRNLRRTRNLGWAAIAPLRMPAGELRERRAQAREAEFAELDGSTTASVRAGEPATEQAGFVAHGGLWVVLLVGIVGVLAYGALLGAAAVSGGGLRPLAETVPELWANIGYGWRELGTGILGAADPFAAVLAVLGSLTFWSPSYSVVLVYFLALPLSALGAWFAARRISRRPWLPVLAALLWSLAPPLLAALADGRLGAVLSHVLLPWLLTCALGASRYGSSRSWASGAAAALLFAVVAAGTPSLVPALLVLLVVLLAARPGSIHRTIGIPLPALVLFGPLIVQQVLAGNPLGLLADPGLPLAGSGAIPGYSGAVSGWRLALADPTGALHGWSSVFAELSAAGTPLPGVGATLASPALVAILLAPLGVLALVALFLPGARRAIPAMAIALLGYLTAVGAAHLQVGAVGDATVTVWPGSGLSLYWLGLVAAAVIGLGALGRMATPFSVLAGLTATALAIPLLGGVLIGTAAVHPASTRILPALVTAEARTHPGAGTLVITSLGEAGISARLERGLGASLDDQSTLVSTRMRADAIDDRIATLAGNLAVRSGYDAAADLEELDILFVLVSPGTDDDTYRATVDALDGNEILSPVGTTASGLLWRYEGETTAGGAHPGNTDTALGAGYLVALGVVFGVTMLLAIPTGGRRRPRGKPAGEEPADTFDEEDHD